MTTRKVTLNSSPHLCDSGMHFLIIRPQFGFWRLPCLLGKCYPERPMSSEYMTTALHLRSSYGDMMRKKKKRKKVNLLQGNGSTDLSWECRTFLEYKKEGWRRGRGEKRKEREKFNEQLLSAKKSTKNLICKNPFIGAQSSEKEPHMWAKDRMMLTYRKLRKPDSLGKDSYSFCRLENSVGRCNGMPQGTH